MSVPELLPSALGDNDVLRRPLFAQVPDELMGWLESEMQNRRPDGHPPIPKNIVVAEALTVYRVMVRMAARRIQAEPLSESEATQIRGILEVLAQPIRLDRSRKPRSKAKHTAKEGQ